MYRIVAIFGFVVAVCPLVWAGAAAADPPTAAAQTDRAASDDKAVINARKAAGLAEQAMKFHFTGKPGLASALYWQAYKLDPQPGYLYSAGRAAQKAGKLTEAAATYAEVLKIAAADSPFAIKAQARLDEIKTNPASKPASAVPPPQNPDKTTPKIPDPPTKPTPTEPIPAPPALPPPPSTTDSTSGWIMVGGGVLAIGGGVLLGLGALNTANQLDGYKDPKTGKYDLSKIDRDELRVQESSYNLRVVGAYGLGIAGVGAVVVGALWLGNAGKVALAPSGRGMSLAVRW